MKSNGIAIIKTIVCWVLFDIRMTLIWMYLLSVVPLMVTRYPLLANRLCAIHPHIRAIRRLLVAGMFITGGIMSVWILGYPSAIDHTLVPVTMSALQLRDGVPLYHTMPNSWPTAILYGPAIHAIHWVGITLVNDPMIGVNMMGLLVGWGAVGVMAWVFWQHYPRDWAWWFWVMWWGFTMLFETNTHFFTTRGGDSLMVLGMALALWGTVTKRAGGWGMVGAAIGLALTLGTKPHAGCYWVPLAGLAWEHQGPRWTVRLIMISLVLSGLMLVNPWVSITGYLQVLAVTRHHPLTWSGGIQNALFAGGVGLWVYAITRMVGIPFRWHIAMVTHGVSMALVCVVASKSGAGAWHLMPFLPVLMWQLAHRLHPHLNRLSIQQVVILYWMVCITSGWMMQRFLIHWAARFRDHHVTQKAHDLRDIRQRFPTANIIMGYTDPLYGDSNMRPYLHRPGQPYGWDACVLMEYRSGGVTFTHDREVLAPYDIIVIPNGPHPFKLKNWYGSPPYVWDDTFIATFDRYYTKTETGRYYTLWRKRPHLQE